MRVSWGSCSRTSTSASATRRSPSSGRGATTTQLELDAALVAVRGAAEHGVRTIVDPTAMFGGRDVRFMKRVADETGVQIVACTGIYSYDYLPHYFENRDVDVMADHFVEDIERGCQGTDIRAAFLKCAADAAGRDRARREDPPRLRAREPADGRADHGPLDAGRRHRPAAGRDLRGGGRRRSTACRSRTAATARTSATSRACSPRASTWVSTATAWRCTCRSTSATPTAAELLRRGHAERLIVSQDFCASIDWFPPEAAEVFESQGAIRNWSMTLVFEEVVPALREMGVMDDAVFDTIFVENPRRWLVGE